MTGADLWTVIAATAAAVSAFLTFVTVLANFAAVRVAAKAADVDSCIDVVTKLAEAQRRVHVAPDPESKLFEFRELLNLMEALALLMNEKRATPSTQKVTEHFLEETWAYLRSQPSLRTLLEDSVTGTETFIELTNFAGRRTARIAHLTRKYEQQKIAPP